MVFGWCAPLPHPWRLCFCFCQSCGPNCILFPLTPATPLRLNSSRRNYGGSGLLLAFSGTLFVRNRPLGVPYDLYIWGEVPHPLEPSTTSLQHCSDRQLQTRFDTAFMAIPTPAVRGGRPRSLRVRPRAADWRTQGRNFTKPHHLRPIARTSHLAATRCVSSLHVK